MWLLMGASAAAQTVIENPERPKSPRAGRTVALKEIGRIRDDGKNIVFRGPRAMSLDAAGALYVNDGFNLYKFDHRGRFVFKIWESGQGPGEIGQGGTFFIAGDRIRVQTWAPSKLMEFDLEGRLLREHAIRIPRPFYHLWEIGGGTFGIRDELFQRPELWAKGEVEAPFALYEISTDFRKLEKLADFPVLRYMTTKPFRNWRRAMLNAATHNGRLYIIHTAEYRVVRYDPAKRRIDRIVTRRYRRRKAPRSDRSERNPRIPQPPPLEYAFDIYQVLPDGDRIWVVTSTIRQDGRERLIDVFDAEGKYVDNFYLRFAEGYEGQYYSSLLLTDDRRLHVIEQDADGFFSIGIYRLIEATD